MAVVMRVKGDNRGLLWRSCSGCPDKEHLGCGEKVEPTKHKDNSK